MPSIDAQRKVDERQKCRTDKLYLSEVMGYDFVAEVHKELFEQFIPYDPSKAWAFQSDIKKRLILWSRGHYKTTSIVVEIVQIILNFPDIRILIMQGSKGVTQNLLSEIKAHFTGVNPKSRVPELFPEFCPPIDPETGERSQKFGTVNHFTVPARRAKGLPQATVTIASPKSIKTGQHYDIGFFDDLVNDQNYRSSQLLRKIKEDFNMCLPLIDPPHYAIVTGTRYAFGDLYEEIIRWNKGEWKVSLTTCWTEATNSLPDDQKIPRFPQQKAKDEQRVIGFTREGLFLLRERDPEMFASQYLNQPIQRGGKRFTEQVLNEALIAPTDAPPLSPAMLFVDLAATDSPDSDDSVIICGKHDTQMTQYVVDARGGQWLPTVLAQNIIEMTLLHRPVTIWLEKTASCMYFVDLLRMIARQRNIFLPIEFLKVSNKEDAKNIRIASLEAYLKNRKLKFFVGLPVWQKMVEQFGKFPGSRHDDYPDTVAYMANTLGGQALALPIRRANSNPLIELMNQQERRRYDLAQVIPQDPEDGTEEFRF
jgi:predicted phage terminase large subunit-like protein